MAYDRELLIHKLQRWEDYIQNYQLPDWDTIPNFGLYMDQVIVLVQQYLSFLPTSPDGKDSFVTASAINNYVRLKVMPAPVKRKYGRVHIAYIMMILTLKLSMSISDIQRLLPSEMSEEQVRAAYAEYAKNFRCMALTFTQQVHSAAEKLQTPSSSPDTAATGLIIEYALTAGFNSLMAEKLIRLADADTKAVLEAEKQPK